MNATNSIPSVDHLQSLFPVQPVFLKWPKATKGTAKAWKHLRQADMTPDYLSSLVNCNIGVALGAVSGGLATIDFDDDQFGKSFLILNPALAESLRTRGQRGFNIWLYPQGQAPRSGNLTQDGQPVGEWRFDGNQTIIAGIHPATLRPYSFLVDAPAMSYPFSQIRWPDGIKPPVFQSDCGGVTHIHHNPAQSTAIGICVGSGLDCGGSEADCVTPDRIPSRLVDDCVPTMKGTNHKALFNLARMIRRWELNNHPLDTMELRSLFGRWYRQSAPFLKPGQGFDDYLFEFERALGNVKLIPSVVDLAWKEAESDPIPHPALVYDDPRLRRLVAFVIRLQAKVGDQPFYLSARDVQRLCGMAEHIQGWRWLRILVRDKILAEAAPGDRAKRHAASFRCLLHPGGVCPHLESRMTTTAQPLATADL